MKTWYLLSIACVAVGLSTASGVRAEPPPLLPVQGYLTNDAGDPLDGDVKVRFRLYAAATGGSALHDETQTVGVQDGHFTVYLGTEKALDLMLFADNGEVHLGLTVESDAEAEPRIAFATVPYAALASYCGDAESLGGLDASQFSLSDHTHAPVNAATLCNDGEYLDGDGTCKTVSNITDTNAGTLCNPGHYLDGDGNCYPVPVDTDTNAGTLCNAGQYLDGDGTCKAVPVDTNTTYTSAAPISLSSTTFGLTNCSMNQIYKMNPGGTAWACSADDDTTYGATAPILLSGSSFALTVCGPNQLYKMNPGGSAWACSADNDTAPGGTAPISVSSNTVSLTTCSAGQIYKMNPGGTAWICATDVGGGTDYWSAGPHAFFPQSSTHTWTHDAANGVYSSGSAVLATPVHLPQGATVTRLQAVVFETDATLNVRVELMRSRNNAIPTLVAGAATSGTTQETLDVSFSHVIDQDYAAQSFHYFIRAYACGTNVSCTTPAEGTLGNDAWTGYLRGVTLTYTH